MKGERRCVCGQAFPSKAALEKHCKWQRREHYEPPVTARVWREVALDTWVAADGDHVWLAFKPYLLPLLTPPEGRP